MKWRRRDHGDPAHHAAADHAAAVESALVRRHHVPDIGIRRRSRGRLFWLRGRHRQRQRQRLRHLAEVLRGRRARGRARPARHPTGHGIRRASWNGPTPSKSSPPTRRATTARRRVGHGANLTGTTTSISAPAVTYDTNAVVTVTVASSQGPAAGAVSLSVDNAAPQTATLSNGQAQFTVSRPAPGDYALTAALPPRPSSGRAARKGSLHVNPAPPPRSSPSFSAAPRTAGARGTSPGADHRPHVGAGGHERSPSTTRRATEPPARD